MITREELKKNLHYSKETGNFTWIIKKQKIKTGTVAGSNKNSEGYVHIHLCGRIYKAHRLAWLYVYGYWPHGQIDHINGVRDDNRLENLRDVTQSDNQRNTIRRKDNTSGLTGVSWHKRLGKWQSWVITKNKKQLHLGYFDNLFDAAAARKSSEITNNYHPTNGRQL